MTEGYTQVVFKCCHLLYSTK